MFPNHRTRFTVKRRDNASRVTVGCRDDEGLINRGGCTVTLVNLVVANSCLPSLLTVDAKSRHEDGIVVGKVDEEAVAVTGNCSRGGRRLLILSHQAATMHFGLPQQFAGRSVITEDRLGLLLFISRREIDVRPDDGRRTVSPTWNDRLPSDILGLAPLSRRGLVWVRVAVPLRPSPPWPIGGSYRDLVVNLFAERLQGEKYRSSDDEQ